MRVLLAILAVTYLGCAGQQHECFECGLTDEWARAERDREQRERERLEAERAAIAEAVELGERGETEHAELISETVYQGRPELLTQLVSSLERTCQPQHPLALDWILHELVTGTLRRTGSTESDELRRRAFYLIAVSRGEKARDALSSCDGSPIEELCARALAAIDQQQHPCNPATRAAPAAP